MEHDLDQVRRWTAPSDGWLVGCRGASWVTRDGELDDHQLTPGHTLVVSAGTRLTMGPWAGAEASRLVWVAAPAARCATGPWASARQSGLNLVAAAARVGAQALAALARKADDMASRAQGSICSGDSMASSGALK